MKLIRNTFLLLLLVGFSSNAQNLQLAANLSYGNSPLANIGGYVDSLGNEYALVGTYNGLDIVDVSVPANPVIRFSVPGPTDDWREVKTYRKYAYVTTEGGGGLVIVDLSRLPAAINYHSYTGDGAINGQLGSIHALHCDTARGFLYLYGSNIGSGNTLFLNLANPWNPVYAGQYSYPGGGNTSYVHDGYAENDTLYEAHIYAGFFAVVDVRNKSNPVLLATQTTPTAFTHNTWLSADHRTLFTTDENSDSYLGAYDISDLSNIQEISRFQTAPGSNAIVHNTHILNDYAITSWYKEGVVITDVSRPHNPVEVGHYDTYPQGSGNGFNGCWGVYPYLPSGTIVASDIDNGLFVLTPNYVRGCYLEGTITDSVTGVVLPGARVQLGLAVPVSSTSGSNGGYALGTVTAGTYSVTVSRPGYVTKTISGVSISNGQLTVLDVQLRSVPTISVEGQVLDGMTGQPVANAIVGLINQDFDLQVVTSSTGAFMFTSVVDGQYELTAGKWGYHTTCNSVLTNTSPFVIALDPGYQDDFTLDFGWTVSGSSLNAWERGEPLGTVNGIGQQINPEFDVTGDCGENCYVTDNGAGPFNSHDVDNGYTLLTSPVFDLTGYINPVIEFDRWFVNNGGSGTPNDSLLFLLSNGTNTVRLGAVNAFSAGTGTWWHQSYPVSSYMTPGPTMQLLVRCEDYSTGHIVEGGIDNFIVTGVITMGQNDPVHSVSAQVFPNPNEGVFEIRFPENVSAAVGLKVFDLAGRNVFFESLRIVNGRLRIDSGLPPGFYVLSLSLENGETVASRFIVR
jgi:choice-of-anchor B domain-containing protein